MRRVAIHQPNFLPWIGYFQKIFLSDVFIFHDNVEYSKKSLTKRTYLRDETGDKVYLGVPLQKHSDSILIKDLHIDNSTKWQIKKLNLVQKLYKSTPFFEEYFEEIQEIVLESKHMENFSDFSIFATKCLLEILDIERQAVRSSELPVAGEKSAYNINLVKYFSGEVYYSGMGASKYQHESDFSAQGIELKYVDTYSYIESKREELPPSFVNGLSIIDNLFCYGPEFILEVLFDYAAEEY